jgi:cysteine-rich repeat protein
MSARLQAKTERPVDTTHTVHSANALRPQWALTTSWFLLSLAVLAANDHVFKGSGLLPGWLTGKLSDVAGMFVAGPLLAVLVRARSRRTLAAAHVATGVGFVIAELVPEAARRLDALYAVAGYSWHATRDVTDLLVLPLLVASFVLVVRAAATKSPRTERRPAEPVVGALALVACLATTQFPNGGGGTCPEIDCDGDGYETPEDCDDFDPSLAPGRGCPNLDGERLCDDGLDEDGDEDVDCNDSDCALPCASAEQVCAGAPVLELAESASFAGTTQGGSYAFEGSCGGADAPEAVFLLTTPQAVRIFVEVPDGHVVYLRSQCATAASEVACASPESFASSGVFTAIVEASEGAALVFDAIDGFDAAPIEGTIEVGSAACGDGSLDSNEQCDDANVLDGDGCDRRCERERGGGN